MSCEETRKLILSSICDSPSLRQSRKCLKEERKHSWSLKIKRLQDDKKRRGRNTFWLHPVSLFFCHRLLKNDWGIPLFSFFSDIQFHRRVCLFSIQILRLIPAQTQVFISIASNERRRKKRIQTNAAPSDWLLLCQVIVRVKKRTFFFSSQRNIQWSLRKEEVSMKQENVYEEKTFKVSLETLVLLKEKSVCSSVSFLFS